MDNLKPKEENKLSDKTQLEKRTGLCSDESYLEKKISLNRKGQKEKWVADSKAINSYRKLWRKVIESDTDGKLEQYEDFMDQVITEMQDIDRIGTIHLKKWKKAQRRSVLFPIISAVLTTLLAFDYDFLANKIPINGIKICILILSVISALLTAWISATKDNGNEDRETWLRQKHYLAKLKLKTEKFLYTWDIQNQESDNSIPQKRLNDYMNTIMKLRKEDWSNFFENMNCPNYDKDYFEK